MSVVAVTIRPDAYVIMAADGAATDPRTGAIAGTMAKILTLPSISALIGITGMGGLTSLMQWFVPPQVNTFDQLVEVLPELVEGTCRFIDATGIAAFGMFQSCVVLAGWSEKRQKFEGWRVVTYRKESVMSDGSKRMLEPFTAYPMPEGLMWSSGGPDEAVVRRFGVIDGPESDSDIDLLVRMICATQQDSGNVSSEGLNFNAGCHVEVAVMERSYCQSWITHRWPEDVIGEAIDPTPGQPLPDHLMAHYDAQA